jgi:hypothetical protein
MADTEDSREKQLARRRARRRANPEKTKAASSRNHAQQRENKWLYAYKNHRDSAKRRGVSFLLTFDEWCAIWRDSGRFEQRGIHRGEYCMARHGDTGPYAVDNVRVCLNELNKREAHFLRRGKPMSANRLAALARAREALRVKHANGAPLSYCPDEAGQPPTVDLPAPPCAFVSTSR